MPSQQPKDYSVWKESALVTSLLINCINTIGFISIGWAVPRREHDSRFEGLGLWTYCFYLSDRTVQCMNTIDLNMPSWFQATQAMAVLSFCFMVTSFFTIVTIECHKKLRKNQLAILVFVLLTLSASLTGMISVIIFGASIDDHPIDLPGEEPNTFFKVSYSYIICSVSSVALIITAFLGVIEFIFTKTRPGMAPASSTTRLDQSFTPYTSFPEIADNGLQMDSEPAFEI